MSAQETLTITKLTPAAGLRARGLRVSRRSLVQLMMVGGVLLVAVLAAYFWMAGGRFVSTDNAYIQAAKLEVATDVSGLVSEVSVKEGQHVSKGDVLFRLDP